MAITIRNHSVDIAKGIGIILIIGLHSDFHAGWMVNFEMPLFFLLSGIFFKTDYNFSSCIVKKSNTLLIPYLFFEVPRFIYNCFFSINHGYGIIEACINTSIPTTTWFLLALFESQLLCHFAYRLLHGNNIAIFAFAAICMLAGYVWNLKSVPNIASLGSMLSLTPYLIIGKKFSKTLLKNWSRFNNFLIGLLSLSICYGTYLLSGESEVVYVLNCINCNPIYALIMALSGSIAIISFSKTIQQSNFLEFYGRNSLIILGTHLYLIIALTRLHLAQTGYMTFIIAVLGVIPVIFGLRKYFPRLCGLKPLISMKKPITTIP